MRGRRASRDEREQQGRKGGKRAAIRRQTSQRMTRATNCALAQCAWTHTRTQNPLASCRPHSHSNKLAALPEGATPLLLPSCLSPSCRPLSSIHPQFGHTQTQTHGHDDNSRASQQPTNCGGDQLCIQRYIFSTPSWPFLQRKPECGENFIPQALWRWTHCGGGGG